MELVCCVCGKVKRNDIWTVARLKSGVLLSHGYCPECLQVALEEVRRYHLENRDNRKLSVA